MGLGWNRGSTETRKAVSTAGLGGNPRKWRWVERPCEWPATGWGGFGGVIMMDRREQTCSFKHTLRSFT